MRRVDEFLRNRRAISGKSTRFEEEPLGRAMLKHRSSHQLRNIIRTSSGYVILEVARPISEEGGRTLMGHAA